MTTLPINNSIMSAPQTLQTLRLSGSSLLNTVLQTETATTNPSITDSVTLSKSATQFQSTSNRPQVLTTQDFFTSYVDTLQQQQRGQSLIQQALNGTSNSTSGLLGNYQSLQYQQNFFDLVFNQKGNDFMNMFSTVV